jgi:predicted SAM-dependent methyltransferase
MKNNLLAEALDVSAKIEKESSASSRFAKAYFDFCFRITKQLEKFSEPSSEAFDANVLNFGCGHNILEGAINTDLFAPHKKLKGRPEPDLYWTGIKPLNNLKNKLSGIVCEHVIEHLLPHQIQPILSNFFELLSPNSSLVISYPDIQKVLQRNDCQGFNYSIVATNSVIYRFGHTFMYDEELVELLLLNAGFHDVKRIELNESSLSKFLSIERECETTYIMASK